MAGGSDPKHVESEVEGRGINEVIAIPFKGGHFKRGETFSVNRETGEVIREAEHHG